MKTTKIIKIGDKDYHYTSGYYTQNKWLDDDTVILCRAIDPRIGNVRGRTYKIEMVKFSLKDKSMEVLCDDMTGSIVVNGGKIYYTTENGLNVYNTKTNKTEIIYKNDYFIGENGIRKNIEGIPAKMTFPHITNDGKYVSLFCSEQADVPGVFIRVNTETGEEEKIFEKAFKKPLNVANHWMICPENKDLFFYAHEGETYYITNRLWLYDYKNDRDWNVAKQRLDENGTLGECYGHEMWAPDGKGVYYVKYPVSTMGPTGVSYVDIETGKQELLYSGYKYWHAGVSRDGRYIVADTQYAPYQSEVVVIDKKSGEEFVVDMPDMTAVHPCHPHPQMSPDNSKVCYNALDEEGRTCVKVAYINHE